MGPDGINDTFLGFPLAQSTAVSPPWNAAGLFPTTIAQCQNDTQYPNFFGTSAAAPHVAAGAALLWQTNSSLTATQIAAALKGTALPMAAGAQGAGAGFVQLDAALAALPAGAPALSISPTEVTVGSPASLTWNSYSTTGCTASGGWSGAPGRLGHSYGHAGGDGLVSELFAGLHDGQRNGSERHRDADGPGCSRPPSRGALDRLTLGLLALLVLARLAPGGAAYFAASAAFARS